MEKATWFSYAPISGIKDGDQVRKCEAIEEGELLVGSDGQGSVQGKRHCQVQGPCAGSRPQVTNLKISISHHNFLLHRPSEIKSMDEVWIEVLQHNII